MKKKNVGPVKPVSTVRLSTKDMNNIKVEDSKRSGLPVKGHPVEIKEGYISKATPIIGTTKPENDINEIGDMVIKKFIDNLTPKKLEVLKNMLKVGSKDQTAEAQKVFDDIKFIKKNDKCCIIGFAPSWDIAPYSEKGIDFWGINELYLNLQKAKITTPFAAWFEVHNIEQSPSKQKQEHQKFLQTCKIPLVTQRHWDKYPSSIAYPVQYIVNYFNMNFVVDEKNTGFSDYSNQISWMIALAIVLGYKEIMVYGVDMAQQSEYAFQRASCQFFLGYATGSGIKVRIPKACELLKAGRLYGFESDNANRFRKKDRIAGCDESVQHIKVRNAEIEFYKEFLDKKLEKDLILVDAELAAMEKDIAELNTMITVADNILNFLNTMPADLAQIDKSKVKLLNANTAGRDKAIKDIAKIKADIKTLKKQREKLEADKYINIKLLEEEFEANRLSLETLQGSIHECKHDLNNNLV